MKTLLTCIAILLLWVILTACSDDVDSIPPGDSREASPDATSGAAQTTITAEVPTEEAPETPVVDEDEGDVLTLASTKETLEPLTLESNGVQVTVTRVAVADYKEFYDSLDPDGKRALDSFSSQTEGAVTIGQFEMQIENMTDDRRTIHPGQGTVVVGNEQVETSLFLSDDVGGEYFPNVLKEGRVFFFLKRVSAAEIDSLTYVISPPHGETFMSDVPEIEFHITGLQ